MRLIPGKTKVQVELFKGVSIGDIVVGAIGATMLILVLISNLPGKIYISIGVIAIFALLLVRIDSEANYKFIGNILRSLVLDKRFERVETDKLLIAKSEGREREMMLETVFEESEEFAEEPPEETYEEVEEEASEDDTSNEDTADENTDDIYVPTGKELKALIKEENKILKSKTATKEEKDAVWLARARRSAAKKKQKKKDKNDTAKWNDMADIMPFTGIKDNLIEYAGLYYGAVIEISPVEFRFFSAHRRKNSIENGLGQVLRSLPPDYSANIIKIDRPVIYDEYIEKEYDKLDMLKKSYESGMIKEEELQSRVEIEYDRINDIIRLNDEDKVIAPFYYMAIFDEDKDQLELLTRQALSSMEMGELKELAVFLKYTNQIDFDEREIDRIAPEDYAKWAMPDNVSMKARTTLVNNIITHNFRIVNYPTVVGDAWLASMLSIPSTKVVIKFKPMDNAKAVRGIDRSLQELRGQYASTTVDSKLIELQTNIETLGELLVTLQGDNESLLEMNIFITAYDMQKTRDDATIEQPPISERRLIGGMKKLIRRMWQEQGFKMNGLDFSQVDGFIASQVSALDPFIKYSRGVPSNTIAAAYPWIFASISDVGGVKLGSSDGVPVFIDFFRRDSERINSNMVIIGKSGSGKSYATKSLLINLAAEDSKIFILDPENEYSELSENLHGKMINVGNAKYGRLNPFHIITALDDDETDSDSVSGTFSTHLQFLEEFFKQILPDCDKDALEYLNMLIERMYSKKEITPETDLSKLKPTDYPIFDDLYDEVLAEFERTDNEYLRTMLRTLINYIAKFSTGGRNANIWNGPSTVTTDENFTVFNFQSMLANRNTTIANAQMLLVLKYVDNEIIKNRDYNTKYGLKRKIVVVIDEAHVFIDTKFPAALDFMFQLAKRIRKYNGMQIVITQNIKDFVGSEEIARKSTAIINASQYSFVFALSPNDIQDLCKLYEKAGGINEDEQEQITTAPRGQAFTIMSPTSRSTFGVEVPEDMVAMFEKTGFESRYFGGEEGTANWEDYIGDSREANMLATIANHEDEASAEDEVEVRSHVTFEELDDSADSIPDNKPKKSKVVFEEIDLDLDEDILTDEAATDTSKTSSGRSKVTFEEISLDEPVADTSKTSTGRSKVTFEEISLDESAADTSREATGRSKVTFEEISLDESEFDEPEFDEADFIEEESADERRQREHTRIPYQRDAR